MSIIIIHIIIEYIPESHISKKDSPSASPKLIVISSISPMLFGESNESSSKLNQILQLCQKIYKFISKLVLKHG